MERSRRLGPPRLPQTLGPLLVAGACMAVPAAASDSVDRVETFTATLDHRVPALLLRYGVPSAVVAVVHEGRTTTRTFGVADLASGRAPSDATLYNVASISKVVTAWAVLRLVEEGRVDLDAPVARYVSRWRLPPSESNEGVTVRRLLSHTSGLSMSAVPWYGPDTAVPSLPAMLSDPRDPLRLVDRPGAAYRYSGGAYALLQLLIEEVSGEPYERYVERSVFQPLGMKHSMFQAPGPGDDAATPYDAALRALPHYRFAATGAAGLYTTAADLARFAAAGMSPGRGAGVLQPATLLTMQTPEQPEKKDPFGFGLGYSVTPLPAGGHLVGHTGSNEGWTASWTLVSPKGDALVVLLNRSSAFPVYRDLLCDWVDAAAGGRWPRFCSEEPAAWTADDDAFVDGLLAPATMAEPAVAVLVANATGVVYRKAFGARDVRAGVAATPETPFYIASLAKSLTAIVALQLVGEGRFSLRGPVGRFLPALPEYARKTTIDELLSHTSGVPDYHPLIDWRRYDGMDNARAMALLGTRSALEFPAGSRYGYSNSGYILVASAIERLTGRPYREVLRTRVLDPLGMRATSVQDGGEPPPEGRALGYDKQNGATVLSDYQTVTIDGREFALRSSTVGPGGMYSTLDDLYALDRALYSDRLLPLSLQLMALAPRTSTPAELEVPRAVGHGYGWFVSRASERTVVWNSGDFAGHHTAMLRVPDRKVVVIVLSSSAARSATAIAGAVADRALARKP